WLIPHPLVVAGAHGAGARPHNTLVRSKVKIIYVDTTIAARGTRRRRALSEAHEREPRVEFTWLRQQGIFACRSARSRPQGSQFWRPQAPIRRPACSRR